MYLVTRLTGGFFGSEADIDCDEDRPQITQRGSAATEVQPANDANEREYKSARSGGFTTAETRRHARAPFL